ncbi:MAG: hypothetical protein ACXWZM_11440, partial [Solirubrobacterales bacterium]
WARGGETSLENLVQLCAHHLRLVHEGGFGVRAAADGELRFTRPGGRPVRPVAMPGGAEIAAPPVTPGGIVPRSRGERLDLDWTLATMPRPG